jgi:hypothetical protein
MGARRVNARAEGSTERRALSRPCTSDGSIGPITVDTRFDGFNDYWSPFLGGQGPAPAYAMALDAAALTQLCERLRAQLPVAADGSIAPVAQTWAVKAVSP